MYHRWYSTRHVQYVVHFLHLNDLDHRSTHTLIHYYYGTVLLFFIMLSLVTCDNYIYIYNIYIYMTI